MKTSEISKQLGSSLEARMLVKHITDLTDADIIASDTITLSQDQQRWLEKAIQRRLDGCPISKIIGFKEFYGRDFIVSVDVLDPRPDSEILIDVVLDYAAGMEDLKILDLGTGSGCLILTLLSEIADATGIATDISDKALGVAEANAKKLDIDDRLTFIQSDWLESIEGQFDIIVSNPPYIESNLIPNLNKTVSNYDPIQALDGGQDGLYPYKMILPQIRNYLKKGGLMVLEHSYDQQERIKRLVEQAGLERIQGHQDLGALDRIVSAIHK